MIWLLIAYGVLLLAIGLLDMGRAKSFDAYVLADRNRGWFLVGTSILASVVGASATLGVADLAFRKGFPAFWWLGSGALGLLVCGLFIARRIREIRVCTLADLVGIMIGSPARRAVSLVIVIGWTGIIAAQFTAAARILLALAGWSYLQALAVAGAVILAYCVLGGQLSVLKTDLLQFLLIVAGLAAALGYLYGKTGLPPGGVRLELLNDSFGWKDFWYFQLIVGSGFIIGPDIFSRLLTSRDSATARRSALLAGAALLPVSAAIVAIGVWGRHFAALPPGMSILPWILAHEFPSWLGVLFSFALLSAIISSSDTCLISAAAIAEHDLLRGERVWRTRLVMLAIGLAAVLLAGINADIIGTLLLAYSLFNCGVIPPVLVAVLAWPSRRLNPGMAAAAVLAGGSLGIAGSIMDLDWLSMLGLGVSLLLALAALGRPFAQPA